MKQELPYSDEAERIVLGTVLLAPHEFEKLDAVIKPADFFKAKHKQIFRAMRNIYRSGAPLDVVTVANYLEDHEEMEVGGRLYLNDLLDNVTTIESFDYYLGVIRSKAQRRALINAGLRIAEAARNEEEDATLPEQALKLIQDATLRDEILAPSTFADLASVIGPIRWAWESWLPIGLLTLLAGQSGRGKSALALRIAQVFIRGDPWPDGTPYEGNTGSVLWCEAEAAQALNLERAKSWGLPLDQLVMPLSDPLGDVILDDSTIFARIAQAARDPSIKLIIVDSLSGAHRSDENSNDIIGIIMKLAQLARDTNKPVLLTHHLRKRGKFEGDEVTLDRLRGSSAIVQPARVIWALDTPNAIEPEKARLAVIKNNLAKFAHPLGMAIDEKGLSFGPPPETPHTESQTDKAADLLLALLRKKPLSASEIQEEADGAGLSWSTIKRAKAQLGISAIRKNDRWLWSLPADEPPF